MGKSFVGQVRPPEAARDEDGEAFRLRLRYVVTLGLIRMAVDTTKELSARIGKGGSQLSKWLTRDPRPRYETFRAFAERVGVSAAWLDDPSSPDAREPEGFAEWLAARRRGAPDAKAPTIEVSAMEVKPAKPVPRPQKGTATPPAPKSPAPVPDQGDQGDSKGPQ